MVSSIAMPVNMNSMVGNGHMNVNVNGYTIQNPNGYMQVVHERPSSKNLKREYDDPESEEDERKKMRRERNREAAARCRARRMELIQSLSKQVEELEKKKAALESELHREREERDNLERVLHVHEQQCNLDVKGSFLHQSAALNRSSPFIQATVPSSMGTVPSSLGTVPVTLDTAPESLLVTMSGAPSNHTSVPNLMFSSTTTRPAGSPAPAVTFAAPVPKVNNGFRVIKQEVSEPKITVFPGGSLAALTPRTIQAAEIPVSRPTSLTFNGALSGITYETPSNGVFPFGEGSVGLLAGPTGLTPTTSQGLTPIFHTSTLETPTTTAASLTRL